jgi:hypothetical protein
MLRKKKAPTASQKVKSNASKLHSKVFELCKQRFPLFTIFQEYTIECDDRGEQKCLFVDIFVKELSLAIECQGEQHFKPNAFFYGGSFEFKRAKDRDELKKNWCEENGIVLVFFKYNDKLTTEFFNKTIDTALRREYERRK